MKITLEPTRKVVLVDGNTKARIWEGTTDAGTPVWALITSITPMASDPAERTAAFDELGRSLIEIQSPTLFPIKFGDDTP